MVISTIGKQELIKLDMFDKKILWELEDNLRISRKQLAKKIRISEERLHYKIERLTKELIEPSIILNYPLLGISQYMILLDKLDEERLKKLRDEAPLFALIQTIGKYQYVLYVLTEDLEAFCKQFLPNQNLEIFPIIKGIPDDYNPFKFKKRQLEKKTTKSISLDKKDYKILCSLSKNPADSLVKLSEKSKIDKKTVKSRIKRLQEGDIIQKIRFAINVFKLGVTAYFLKIDTTPENKEKIISAIRQDCYSGFIYKTYTGLFMWYMPPSHKELFELTKSLESIDKKIKIDSMQSADVIKLETVPGKVLEILKERAEEN